MNININNININIQGLRQIVLSCLQLENKIKI